MNFLLLVFLCFLPACENPSLDPGGQERGKGKVVDFSLEPNIRVALYLEVDLKSGKKTELNYGAMDAYFVTLDDNITYMVDWNDIEDFKSLKKGQEVPYRSNGYFARLEKNGKVFRVIRLNEI
ncbi:hypothetical protein COW36_24075 [bacterium (Candidatus Blackallbacteria) CG17_big_fil_post_rev_8_21_14_2_50_48_46]|uniref:Uncharacterized protein n=1 Tax=bacterium (Candidatus Blackallbacteria) CG17_big_fil_post_rev_8_21_14_2_50_48_46 TaxID=2014261 RepID=A0A2M7FXB4_9BACT|nr:MAG: hypothetical protein COW64_19015 [bacterium (Candidatus Blackallbacteria) CG18_big_fil_WC_8_21_14_2_50_49_26]PIW13749.1 MAG: hypothetical protein COW36_24075 [bacterium (Candidatus Blackallbacteria) CG17_big_fil_post_rev_8_21_14_2_50_48_46]PIW44975.1 MAG: hypothetical protein COW20_21705 [bacterium (Candidatus Blackallbacteria) CG13_big_fil_rev_8_21_14_2_50_49_14]